MCGKSGPRTFFTLAVQRPVLVCVKVRVPAHSRSGVEGVGQRATLSVKQRHVAVETGGEQQHDVSEGGAVAADDGGPLGEGERRDALPHVERLADGGDRPLLPHRGRDLLGQDAGAGKQKALGGRKSRLLGERGPRSTCK